MVAVMEVAMPTKLEQRVFVALGSNLAEPARQLSLALARLGGHPAISQLTPSSLYESEPWGNPDQPAFINAVTELRTSLEPDEFLALLLDTERRQGRVRNGHRWGPRVVDLDLLAWGDRRISQTGLKVPHPQLAGRRFVLLPWAEIAPEFQVPGLGRVQDLLERCPDTGSVSLLAREDTARPEAATAG